MAFVGMGTSVAGCVAVGVVLGIFGDDRLHTSPLLLVIGLVVGVGAAIGSVLAQVRRYL
jgi:F0F1-type ATP synthase assembly protein I